MKKFGKSIILLLVAVLVLAACAKSDQSNNGAADSGDARVKIYFFWGDGCPHCASAKPVLEDIAAKNPDVAFLDFEVYNSTENQQIFMQMGTAYNMQPQYVPTIFVADRYWVGFSPDVQAEIETAIQACLANACTDLGAGVLEQYTSK